MEFGADLEKVRFAGRALLALIEASFEPSLLRTSTGASAFGAAEPSTETVHELGARDPDLLHPVKAPEAFPAGGRLLVVDDDAANRDVLSRRLERQGYAVESADSGQKALDMLRDETFDLVLLDIMMPEMDGYEVLQRLKADDRLCHMPVIVVSALTDLDSAARCVEIGADEYLPKPFNPILLQARVRTCLEKKLARDREMVLFDQLKQNYKRLQELEKLRDDLTHMIIHDMRTPLTSVIAGMQTLDLVGDLNAAQTEMMGVAVSGGENLLSMINDLLDVEKLEAGAMSLDYTLLSPFQVAAAALGQVAALAASKQLVLESSVDAGLPMLRGDENKLRRVLVNLIGNAIKFTPSGGTVTVAARHCAGPELLEFTVSDTGEGIPPEAFGQIFEKFGQVKSRQGGRTLSTGIGLAFCRLAVEAHGGRISVESVPGEGSTFRFCIPLQPPG